MSVLGFSVTIHKSLTQPLLLLGVPREIAIINLTLGCAIGLGLQTLYALPANILIHVVAVVLTKKDPYFFQVILRSIRKKSYYRV
ncbi:ABC transporter substrate-binding protein [Piscirickettsia salmonis]|uniref:Conjugal transfer protein TrbD n=1 Tax=Piscirickettsia salmonis TaxID=1238 RepID=A0A095BSS1_PISSA|nr:VirB3 family type IV secretion system protein [Piscirickettsia salmonis]OAJ33844.1 Type IV secretory pathway, VirB3-like protein [Piscirickettsiaceae bacterium NZ-RLO1]RNC77746.1 ABC transporter substrate-binding protein [Piscirickettsiaceae bacterium NZ-RLO2]AKP72327.1 ABC transporter substrate-binding protein [Piscirickettsia salmonis LF-89 = ATCC VR-1361]ALA23594.1 type IV secretion system protein VirB3 [Piscirickettsia salmonis]ALB24220.1 type IV secretion system protein VirB3 [Pisciric